jgi:hypothetical protein
MGSRELIEISILEVFMPLLEISGLKNIYKHQGCRRWGCKCSASKVSD